MEPSVLATRALVRSSRFEVRGRLGAGATSVVLRAFDRKLDREVALKLPKDPNARALRHLRAEFEAVRDHVHPNLVNAGELFDHEDPPFFTMELVEGVSFIDYVRESGECDEARLRDCSSQLVRALRCLHRGGRVHRDVKPSNVRVTRAGRVVLLDFGLSTNALEDAAWEASPSGTASYMAPEQAVGRLSSASDFYALGTLIYEALTGELPFSGAFDQVLLNKSLNKPPALRTRSKTAEDLALLCQRLMAIEPGERPSAGEILRALELRRSDKPPSSSASFAIGAVPVLGRDEELVRALSACQRGATRGVEVLIAGSPGSGKSALLTSLSQRLLAADRNAWTLMDSAAPRPWIPYQGVSGAIAQLVEKLKEKPPAWVLDVVPPDAYLFTDIFPVFRRLSAFARIEEGPRAPDPVERRWRAFAALRAFLQRLAERAQITIFIDELHWVDGDTLTLLRTLVEAERGGIARPRVRWVLASDAGLPSELLGALETISLSPLGQSDVAVLADELLESDAADHVLSYLRKYPHSREPRYIVEVFRQALFFGVDSVREPGTLDDLIAARIRSLDADPLRLLQTCVVAGRPLPLGQLGLAAELDSMRLLRSLGVLRSAGLLRDVTVEDERSVLPAAFAVRAQIIASTEQHTVREINLRLLAASQGADLRPNASLLRFQLGTGHLEAARRTAHVAARAAEDVLAFEHAAHIYELASAAWEGMPDDAQRDVLAAMARVLANAGHAARAATSFDRASEGAKVADALEFRRRAAEQWMRGGYIEQGMSELDGLLKAIGSSLPKEGGSALMSLAFQRAALAVRGLDFQRKASRQVAARDLTAIDVFWSVGSLVGLIDFVSGADFQTRAVREALRAGEPSRIAKALCLEAIFTSASERSPRRRSTRMIEVASLIADELDDPHLRALYLLARASVCMSESRFAETVDASLAAERLFRERCVSVMWELGQAQQLALLALMQLGDLEELARRAARYTREASERGDLYGFANIAMVGGFMTPLLEDQPDKAQMLVTSAMERWPRTSFHVQHFFELTALVQIDLYRGGPAAYERMMAAWPGLKKSMLLRVPMIAVSCNWLLGLALLANHKANDEGAAKKTLREVKRAARGIAAQASAHGQAFVNMLLAQSALVEGDSSKARAFAERARADVERLNFGMFRERVQYLCGTLLGGPAGRAEQEDALESLRARGVSNPLRYVRQGLPVLGES